MPKMVCSMPPKALSSKELVLLGLLAEGASHAYALEEQIRSRHMDEWTEIAQSSIYRLLDKLAQRGLIDAQLEQAEKGAPRKVYSINRDGHEALASGVLCYLAEIAAPKNPFHISLANITAAPRQQVIERFAARAEAIAAFAAEVDAVATHVEGGIVSSQIDRRAEYCLRAELLFSHIQHHLRAEREYLVEALEKVGAASNGLFASSASRHGSMK